jgi:hypothetical protein
MAYLQSLFSNTRLKFKHPFETAIGWKGGDCVISRGCPGKSVEHWLSKTLPASEQRQVAVASLSKDTNGKFHLGIAVLPLGEFMKTVAEYREFAANAVKWREAALQRNEPPEVA